MLGGPVVRVGEVVVDVDEVEDRDGGAIGGLGRSKTFHFEPHPHVIDANRRWHECVVLSILPSAVEVGGTEGASNLIGLSFWCLHQAYKCSLTYNFQFNSTSSRHRTHLNQMRTVLT